MALLGWRPSLLGWRPSLYQVNSIVGLRLDYDSPVRSRTNLQKASWRCLDAEKRATEQGRNRPPKMKRLEPPRLCMEFLDVSCTAVKQRQFLQPEIQVKPQLVPCGSIQLWNQQKELERHEGDGTCASRALDRNL